MEYKITYRKDRKEFEETIEAKEMKVISGYLYLYNRDGSTHAVFQDWLRAIEVK
jgi:hypothetical protein